MLALVATIDDHIEAPFIDAPNNNGNVVGVNHAADGRAEIINLILSSDELSDAEKVKFLKILQK